MEFSKSLKFLVKNTGDDTISIRDKNCELVDLKPGDEAEIQTFVGNENIVLTPDSQPWPVTALGAYD